MSDDLISRSALIKSMCQYVRGEKTIGQIIDEQPTAYDVDKVAQQISELQEGAHCIECQYRERCDYEQEAQKPSDKVDLCALVIKTLAIGIVKRGGIDGD